MKRYQSDAYDADAVPPREMEFIRADGRALRKLLFGLLSLLALEIGALWLFAQPEAQEWTKPTLKCMPTVTDFEHAYEVRAGVVAIVFWCNEPDGLYTFWITGTVPTDKLDDAKAMALRKLAVAGRDPIALEQFIVRSSSEAELELVRDIQVRHGPRCYVTGTGQTAGVVTETAQHLAGTPRLDVNGVAVRIPVGVMVTCADRIEKELEKRYCAVTGATDSKGRVVEADSWALCQIKRAPAEGWK